MIWTHEYHPAARWGLLNKLPRSVAERLDAAVIHLAETGRGPIARIHPENPHRFLLRVSGAEAELFLDRSAGTILVTGVYRRSE
jgi:hypothetical protein